MTGITLIMALKMGNTQRYNDKNDLYLESEHCKQPTYIYKHKYSYKRTPITKISIFQI
jgi:hypothetical protein